MLLPPLPVPGLKATTAVKWPWISHVTLFNRTAGSEEKVNKENGVGQSKELIEKLHSLKIKVVSIKTYINN